MVISDLKWVAQTSSNTALRPLPAVVCCCACCCFSIRPVALHLCRTLSPSRRTAHSFCSHQLPC